MPFVYVYSKACVVMEKCWCMLPHEPKRDKVQYELLESTSGNGKSRGMEQRRRVALEYEADYDCVHSTLPSGSPFPPLFFVTYLGFCVLRRFRLENTFIPRSSHSLTLILLPLLYYDLILLCFSW